MIFPSSRFWFLSRIGFSTLSTLSSPFYSSPSFIEFSYSRSPAFRDGIRQLKTNAGFTGIRPPEPPLTEALETPDQLSPRTNEGLNTKRTKQGSVGQRPSLTPTSHDVWDEAWSSVVAYRILYFVTSQKVVLTQQNTFVGNSSVCTRSLTTCMVSHIHVSLFVVYLRGYLVHNHNNHNLAGHAAFQPHS